ncbi:putative ABC transporter permease [Sedimentibacter sp. MB31-C6]|uniref:putative ABC transporter permease n=1 Tax=Sedimentibacter sp. MB31-C6 TaxID=3109366 RepID=UPI002DDDA213|nr:putative ABC transporter permease [Sedimentibacter sp. MB36-C1]WSI05381.1 putative ABC transporter permease [Sedimentibacter sp. MB36-C1]
MQYNLIDLTLFFIIYGFGGSFFETLFGSIINKKLIIRGGFLTNYFCPLYGLCAIVIISIYTFSEISIDSRFNALLIATLGSIIAVTFLEYLVGRILDKVFNHKMWDYSKYPLNLHSYICLDFSMLWGIVSLLLSSFIHPIMEILVFSISNTIKYNVILIVSAILFVNASYNIRKMFPTHIIKL